MPHRTLPVLDFSALCINLQRGTPHYSSLMQGGTGSGQMLSVPSPQMHPQQQHQQQHQQQSGSPSPHTQSAGHGVPTQQQTNQQQQHGSRQGVPASAADGVASANAGGVTGGVSAGGNTPPHQQSSPMLQV